jgi:hypothetical protein
MTARTSRFEAALPADMPAATCSSIAAALEAALRAAAYGQDAENHGCKLAQSICSMIVKTLGVEQQQQRQVWPGSAAQQQQLQVQLHSLLLSCLKVAAASASAEGFDLAGAVEWPWQLLLQPFQQASQYQLCQLTATMSICHKV